MMVREGRASEAQIKLKKIRRAKLPRPLAWKAASLARRVNLDNLAVSILNPIVRPGRKHFLHATAQEKAEYAQCLTKIGAPEEALAILKGIREPLPDVWKFQAAALIAEWNYDKAIPLLARYIECGEVEPYQIIVAKVNMASALVYERQFGQASEILEHLLEETQNNQYTLLHGNSLELAAQSAIFQKQWSAAAEFLSRAERVLFGTGTLDEFFVMKWRAILTLSQDSENSKTLSRLHRVGKEARERGHWETIRDCDRIEALITHNKSLLTHVYFGTPHESFRKWLCVDSEPNATFMAEYLWTLHSGKEASIFDLKTGRIEGSLRKHLEVGDTLHQLFIALCRDFYRPCRLPALHYQLYPNEFYNPVTSPNRVYQVMNRMRKWIKVNRLPIEISEEWGHYWLTANRPFRIRITDRSKLGKIEPLILDTLQSSFGNQPFSVSQASEALSVSIPTALRRLSQAVSQGSLVRVGKGPGTKYCVPAKMAA